MWPFPGTFPGWHSQKMPSSSMPVLPVWLRHWLVGLESCSHPALLNLLGLALDQEANHQVCLVWCMHLSVILRTVISPLNFCKIWA
jgi:hypothetical protein